MDWWRRKLKHLIKHFGCKVVADSILNAVYFPYPSVKYHRGTPDVPSQTYTFNLVKEAMKREAIIVFMRKGDNWLNAIPELASYKRGFRVLNTQNPCIGPNCPGYHEIVNAIEATQV
jgi:hypothetical protein